MRYNAGTMPDLFIAGSDTTPSQPQKKAIPDTPPSSVEDSSKASKKVPSLFMSYCRYPDGITFEHQEKDEEVILFLRKHFITNVRWITSGLLLLFLPIIGILALNFSGTEILLPMRYVTILTLFYYLIIFGYMLIHFVIWFYNVGLITPLRVVDIDISHITSRNVAATNIADIVDVEYAQKGLLSSFFDYGDIHMQTEGVKPNFEFLSIPHPAKAGDTISDLIGGRDLNA